jgi:hypothetical protein
MPRPKLPVGQKGRTRASDIVRALRQAARNPSATVSQTIRIAELLMVLDRSLKVNQGVRDSVSKDLSSLLDGLEGQAK